MATRKPTSSRKQAAANAEPAESHGGPLTRRWIEQRWTIDNTIRAVGMDWDQPRSIYLSSPMGVEANADFAGIRQRITKLADADRKSTRLNSSHSQQSRMPSSA